MSTVYYKLAHQVLPIRANVDPLGTWEALSGAGWSTWLATVSHALGEPVRGVGVEGVLQGSAVQTRDGIEMLAVYFPAPTGPGEPYFAIFARAVGSSSLRSFVFEAGIPEPAAPVRVVMAEWRVRAEGTMRLRFDVVANASLEACLKRTARVVGSEPQSPTVKPSDPTKPSGSKLILVSALLALFAGLVIWLLT